MHQHEAAGAIGVLGHASRKARLAEEGALLVARHAADVDGRAQKIVRGISKMAGRGLYLRHQRARNAQECQQLVVPLVAVHIEEHGAAGVAHIGHMAPAASQLPDEPGIHGAKGKFAALGGGTRAGDVVE
ncbi:hypothetical protein D3C72_1072470 [compost metagenome]